MQAVVINKYGAASELHVAEIDKPVPGDHEVLVNVKAASINPIDWKIRRGDLRLLLRNSFPRVVGTDCAGVIEAVGKAVKNFAPGDAVFGALNPLRSPYGSYAQFAIAETDGLALKPEGLSFVDAASIPVAGLTAIKALRAIMKLSPGQSVLINGASGGVGSFAVQIAKVLGCNVTALCGAANLQYVKDLGADVVYDYNVQDALKLTERFNGILDATANLSFFSVEKLLQSNGIYVTTVPSPPNIVAMLMTSVLPGKRAAFVFAGNGATSCKELSDLAELLASGKIKSVISRTIGLAEVSEAHRVAEEGHTRGKIVIDIA